MLCLYVEAGDRGPAMTPLLRSDPIGGSESNPGCHKIVMPPVGALISLTFIYYNLYTLSPFI